MKMLMTVSCTSGWCSEFGKMVELEFPMPAQAVFDEPDLRCAECQVQLTCHKRARTTS